MTISDELPTVINVEDDPAADGADGAADADHNWDDDIHRVGRYVLLERLGAGAFGVVRAAYDPELDRKVAVKLLSSVRPTGAGSTTSDPAELLEEARMVAKLSHPNVVAVYDVGRLHEAERYGHRRAEGPDLDGVYIVMEHLGGPALFEWIGADEQRRPWPEILEAFLAAGRGLAAAHAQDLVHRDFKPQNLRFGEDGRIRVLDFGLARLARQLARNRSVSGTPLFMAPEQLRGEATDMRSDQYAYCVALWIGLYGSWPFTGPGPRELLEQKQQPPAPPTDTKVPAWIGALLQRGLDSDPAARFRDMPELLAALSDDPRERRRRRLLALGLAFGLAGAGYGASTALDQSDRCALAEDHFAGVWDSEARALVRDRFDQPELPYAAASLATVEVSLDRYISDWSRERVETCEASLERGEQSIDETSLAIECLERQLRQLGAVSSSLQRAEPATILHAADVLAELGRPSSCREQARVRIAARAQLGAGAGALELERQLVDAETMFRIGEYRQAVEASELVLAAARESGELASEARALVVRARALTGEHEYEQALSSGLEAYRSAVEIRDEATTADALIRILEAYRQQGEYDRAELVAELAEGIIARVGPDIRVDYLFARGLLDMDRKHWDGADAYFDEVLALATELYGPGHLQVGLIVLSQGIVDSASRRDFDGALEHFNHALEIFQANYGELHPRIASSYNNIGGVHFRRGQHDKAVVEFERSLAIYEAIYGPEHPQTMRALGNLGAAVYLRGDSKRATQLFRRTLEIRAKTGGRDTPSYLTTESNLAALLNEAGEHEQALPLLMHIYERRVASLGPEDAATLAAAGNLAVLGVNLEDEALVERYGAMMIEGMARLPEDNQELPDLLGNLHTLHAHHDDHEQALVAGERLVAVHAASGGETNADANWAAGRVAGTLNALGRHAQARERASAALARLSEDPERDRVREVGLLMALAKASAALGDDQAARQSYAEVVEILSTGERGRADLARARLGLAGLSEGQERQEHARAVVELLDGVARVEELRAEAQALLDHG